MNKKVVELSLMEMPIDEKDGWILTLPRGKWVLNGEKVEFDDTFYNDIETARNSGKFLPPYIDLKHRKEESYGEIIEAKIDEKGYWTKWELTEDGKELIKKRKWRSFSPTVWSQETPDGQYYPKVLLTLSLSNLPAQGTLIPQPIDKIELEQEEQNKTGEKRMEQEKIQLELIQKTTLELETVRKENDGLRLELEQVKNQKEEANKQLIGLQQKVNAIENESLKKEASEFVGELMECSLIHAKQAQYWELEYQADKEKVVKAFEGIERKKSVQLSAQSNQGKIELEAKDRDKMILGGLDPESEEDKKIYLSVRG